MLACGANLCCRPFRPRRPLVQPEANRFDLSRGELAGEGHRRPFGLAQQFLIKQAFGSVSGHHSRSRLPSLKRSLPCVQAQAVQLLLQPMALVTAGHENGRNVFREVDRVCRRPPSALGDRLPGQASSGKEEPFRPALPFCHTLQYLLTFVCFQYTANDWRPQGPKGLADRAATSSLRANFSAIHRGHGNDRQVAE